MRTVYMIPTLIVALFAQVTIAMAQSKPDEVDPEVYGTYEGMAKTTIEKESKTGKETKKGEDKSNVKIEIKKGEKEEGYTVVVLKDFSIEDKEFAEIPYDQCLLNKQDGGDKWQVLLESNLYLEDLETKDKKYKVTLHGNIDDKNSYVDKNGNLTLSFSLSFDFVTWINYSFTGKKVNITDGIQKLNSKKTDNVIYDLQGRRISKPTKGIYIVNGKKVVY